MFAYWTLEGPITCIKLFESSMKLAWKAKKCNIKDTKSDHLNFELVTFKFGLILSEFNNLNLYSIGTYF